MVLVDYVNKFSSILLEQRLLPKEQVLDFRKRFANTFSLYLHSQISRARNGTNVTVGQMMWRRTFDGAVIPFYMPIELISKIKDNLPPTREIAELYTIGSL
ncbi:hypothetical protein, partial [Salmonella sp. s54925]|uniref:hypothetical protein n=1 Tax=Salmonella sp. s54925 TaxID=3159674 RepID=UPI00397EB0BF